MEEPDALVARGMGAAGLAAALLAAVLASGCARFSPDAGMGVVQAAAANELGKDVVKINDPAIEAHVAARVQQLVAKPLSVSSVVQIALLNNRGLQAAYNELGISEAEFGAIANSW